MVNPIQNKTAEGRTRSTDARDPSVRRGADDGGHDGSPAAGAHAASHLINEDATPGAGALPSYAHASGKEVDGGAG